MPPTSSFGSFVRRDMVPNGGGWRPIGDVSAPDEQTGREHVDMSTEPHAAAMTLFRLVGAGMKFRLRPQGVELVVPKQAQNYASETEAHAQEIAELLRFQLGKKGEGQLE